MSITLAAIASLIVKSAPSWLGAVGKTILDKGREAAIDKGKGLAEEKGKSFLNRTFHTDEKEQTRHLEQALKNAVELGLANFTTQEDRDLYKDILATLMMPGDNNEKFRQEALQLFSLDESPNFCQLSEKYNLRNRISSFAQNQIYKDIDITPYLMSFFNALLGRLYADPYFRQQMGQVLQLRAMKSIQQSILDVVTLLQQMGETLENKYTAEQFSQDLAKYAEHIEKTFYSLKIVSFTRRDNQKEPKIEGIFVPLHVEPQDYRIDGDKQALDNIIPILEQHPYIVLLGGPGAGKSTAIRYLTWCHAIVNQQGFSSTLPLLSGHPLPLRIELRRLSEERKIHNYNFLSFVTEVLLKREGLDIDQRLFKELLTRGMVLLLFDGLDEVASTEERIRMVDEIEHFTQHYPGNRVIVTTRPVGYDLARLSNQLFLHAQVQPFNDEQISLFLHNWYNYVLDISPLPHEDLQEITVLLDTLKHNRRLHKLAENPLLLTVITQLHRSSRLPDKRVLVYDRCAELLMETWAKIKGTDARWGGMKMISEDQYPCIAHLGFYMHKLSQTQEKATKGNDEELTSDATIKAMVNQIELFLRIRGLITDIASQRAEAKLFIELIRIEAGLIVERGTDENGELLYGFVHRTFQEYFAAVYVYDQYEQETDLAIIGDFLIEHLHDPYWREVIFLLFGKLKPKPVTKLLRQILDGTIISQRSLGTDILQQDLFFICDCLVEEIAVEAEFVLIVIKRLKDLVKASIFTEQSNKALEYLGALIQARQYGAISQAALIDLTKDASLTLQKRLEATMKFYLANALDSDQRLLAAATLTSLLHQLDLSIDQVLQIAIILSANDLGSLDDFTWETSGSDEQRLGVFLLTSLLQRSDLSIDQMHRIADNILQSSTSGSDERLLAAATLTSLLQRPGLSADQALQVALDLFQWSPSGSDEQRLAASTLTSLLQRLDLSVDHARLVADGFFQLNGPDSDEQHWGFTILTSLLQRSDLSINQTHQLTNDLFHCSPSDSDEQRLAASTLASLLQRPDLSIDQTRQIAGDLFLWHPSDSDEQLLATSTLASLLQRPDLSVDQTIQIAVDLFQFSLPENVDERLLATSTLASLLQRPDLSADQAFIIALDLFDCSPSDSDERLLATSMLTPLLQRPDLSVDEARQIADNILQSGAPDTDMQLLAASMLISLLQRPDLSIDQTRQVANSIFLSGYSDINKQLLATSTLVSLLQRSDLSTDQACQIAVDLFQLSPSDSDDKLLLFATRKLLDYLRLPYLDIHNKIYNMLLKMVPQFHRLPK